MTVHSKAYQVTGPDIVFEEFDGDLVVLNLQSGQYFGMNPIGALIWAAVVQGVFSTEIALAHAYPKSIEFYLQRLVELNLIEPCDTQGVALSDTSKNAITTITDVPTIDAYDDLSDLLIADPIHDVDQDWGWPKRPDGA